MHERWLAKQTFNHPAQQIIFQDQLEAINAVVRLAALEQQNARDRADVDDGTGSDSLPSPGGVAFLVARPALCWQCSAGIGDLARG
jgi:hypothetical protein